MPALPGRKQTLRRISTLAACSTATLVLVACGGAGGGGSGSGFTVPDPVNPFSDSASNAWVTSSDATNFNPIEAGNWFNSAAYAFINNDGGSPTASEFYGNAFADGPYNGNAYKVVRLHTAHGAGLSGAGLYVAIVDDGFRTTHEVFNGKIGSAYGGSVVIADHGTHVASLIGANPNTSDMVGVAYGANLHLTSTEYTGVDPSVLALATAEAASLNAVAQNNSWGYTAPGGGELLLQDVQEYMYDNNISSAATALTALLGSSNSNWQAYFDALEDFQDSGVIVWALSNDSALNDADATAGLAVLEPDLQGAWITVANGLFDLDSNLNITDAALISAPCGQTAQFCLTASGTTFAASGDSDTSYEAGTGTSYAAPIVTGAVALIAEAFPSLSPEEWTKRLLASAYNDFNEFTEDGITDFGNGVEKYYSETWGQGVLDLEAALSPIGSVSLINGRDVQSGSRHALSSSHLDTGGAFGDSVTRALSGTDIAVFDALNGDFYIDGSLLTRDTTASTADSAAIPRLGTDDVDKLDLGAWGLAAGDEIAFEDLGYSFGFAAVGGSEYLQGTLGLSSENVDNASVLSLANDTTAVYGRLDMGFADFEHYGFIGTHDNAENAALAGVGGAVAFDFDALELTIGAAQMSERGGYLGMTASEAFTDTQETAISALSLAASTGLTENFTLFGGIEYGVASGTEGSGYVSDLASATFSGFQVGAQASNLWLNADRLTLTASQPLRVETGTMSMEVPVGRTPGGEILYDTVTADLAPSGRQLDLGVSYAFEPNPDGIFELGFVYSLDAGHIAGEEAAAIGATFKQAF
ncbi:S8 family peptidase [Pelagibacterium xiamenense]|uniref:S8 family peptidase n=1 Tax=Pelagibacterium xiamenense TaxID=2901140 RepID=UPI001E2A4318|nr:S8 family peptidase [Pelagibacterium xiamenense]MCD7060018.1 S8 family serine peptidase [Pelagibacterium xiamenense]